MHSSIGSTLNHYKQRIRKLHCNLLLRVEYVESEIAFPSKAKIPIMKRIFTELKAMFGNVIKATPMKPNAMHRMRF